MVTLDPIAIMRALSLVDYLEYPWVIPLILPLMILIIPILRRDFVKLKEDDIVRRRRKLVQKIMMLTRTIIFLLVLIAIASPYQQQEKEIQGDPVLRVIVDNSSSMHVLESLPPSFIPALKDRLEVEVLHAGSAERSDIGDTILGALGEYESVLLVTDGNVNGGSSLGDVALYAARQNSSIHAVSLASRQDDASVSISGPGKTLSGVESTFTVRIRRTGGIGAVPLLVTLDGREVLRQTTTEETIEIKQTLGDGYHTLTASIDVKDFFAQNNMFYKTVKTVPKPTILYVSGKGESPLLTLLRQVFLVQTLSDLPANAAHEAYKSAYALVINDMSAGALDPRLEQIEGFVRDGNGLIVTGGHASFDEGNYRFSAFENLLPVRVGSAEKKEGDINIVFVIDISGSTGSGFGKAAKTVDVEKAMAVDVLDHDIKRDNKVAVIAFNTQAYLIGALQYKYLAAAEYADRIAKLKDGGGTLIGAGLLKAIEVLRTASGSKNIILISDGRTQGPNAALEAARLASNEGIRIYSVGTGDQIDEEVLLGLAEATNGVYFRASEASRLRLLFGDTESQDGGTDRPGLVIFNKHHFITENIENYTASITGFNAVVPKITGRMLVTTSTGEPILTVGRLGLGRVATMATDDGTLWAGELLAEPASRLWVRAISWAIGDPDRKAKNKVDIADTRVNEPTELLVKSETQPKAEGLSLYRVDAETFAATITPTTQGVQRVLDATFAANYPYEYEAIGQSDDLSRIVGSTGGRMFSASDVDGIVDAVKTRAKRTAIVRENVRYPWIVAAIIIFLLEIFIRRWLRKE